MHLQIDIYLNRRASTETLAKLAEAQRLLCEIQADQDDEERAERDERLAQDIATAAAIVDQPEESATEEVDIPAPKKAKAAKKKSAPKKAAKEEPKQDKDSPPDAPLELTVDDARDALKRLTGTSGMDAGIEMLGRYNAERISELPEDTFSDFIADCDHAGAA